jgi:MFS family permease
VTTRWPDFRHPRLSVSVVFVAVMFMTIMDSTVVNVALPTLRREFGVSTASVSAVVTSYLVAVAVVMPASGWLGDRAGGKRVLVWALALFTAAPATGPVLGGVIVDGLSWRWIFYLNVPVGVAALAFGAAFLPPHRQHAAGRFDLPCSPRSRWWRYVPRSPCWTCASWVTGCSARRTSSRRRAAPVSWARYSVFLSFSRTDLGSPPCTPVSPPSPKPWAAWPASRYRPGCTGGSGRGG